MRTLFFFFIIFACCDERKDCSDSETIDHQNGGHVSSEDWIKYEFSSNIRKLYNTSKDNHLAAYLYSNIGDYFSALEFYEKGKPLEFSQDIYFDTSNLKAFPALEFIAEQASKHQVVIINEAHHVSYHRFFTTLLLKELRTRGFNYFGAETLSTFDSILSVRKYPALISGYYSVEPQYGNMIREAFNSGYAVFAYEPNHIVNEVEREIAQARNIEKIIKKDPKARILIHCGYSHLLENENIDGWGKAMAGRLKEYTGIDPLTIDQVELTEHFDKRLENPYFRKFNFNYFAVIQNNATVLPISFRMDGVPSDIFVYHPRTSIKYNRPNWLFSFYVPKIINDKITVSFPVLVKAFISNENEMEAVPVDVIEISNKNDTTALVLTPGKSYKIVIENTFAQKQVLNLKLE